MQRSGTPRLACYYVRCDVHLSAIGPNCAACADELDLIQCGTMGKISTTMRSLFKGVPSGSTFQQQLSDAAQDDIVPAETVPTQTVFKPAQSVPIPPPEPPTTGWDCHFRLNA